MGQSCFYCLCCLNSAAAVHASDTPRGPIKQHAHGRQSVRCSIGMQGPVLWRQHAQDICCALGLPAPGGQDIRRQRRERTMHHSTAFSTSASSKTSRADLPPSSIVVGMPFMAAHAFTFLPLTTLPVNATLASRLSELHVVMPHNSK